MIEHRDPNCTGRWRRKWEEQRRRIRCFSCGANYPYRHQLWLEAKMENVAGEWGALAARAGAKLIENEGK